jgi:4'-phosphopantetheinyl transferase
MLPDPRHMFIASHYGMHCILASYLDVKPERLEFQVDACHKPFLKGTPELSFNLTHSGEIALCAVAQGKQIGVDVEIARPIAEMEAIASSQFTREEYRPLSLLPLVEKQEAFLSIWTHKEAFLKAMGQGLHYPLDCFRVPLEPSTIDQQRSILDEETGQPLDWSLFSFSPTADYLAAVVIEGEVDECPTLHHFVK